MWKWKWIENEGIFRGIDEKVERKEVEKNKEKTSRQIKKLVRKINLRLQNLEMFYKLNGYIQEDKDLK